MPTEFQPLKTKTTVVIIDDDRNILEMTALILSKRGFGVFTTHSAHDGLALIAAHSPELVLLDYMMPEMDGLSALRQIKSSFPESYVVLFTGRGSEEIAVELMKGGASEYIIKPFNSRNLVERLENVLRIREIELHNIELQREHGRLQKEIEQWNHDLQQRVREKTEALQSAQNEIAQSEKLAALGYLSAGMAHEIRNPLNSIALFVQLMRQSTVDPEQLGFQSKILKEVDRVDSIIRKLLNASRRTRTVTSDVQIDQVIDTVLEVFSPQIESKKVQVERHYHVIPSPIKADSSELEQIFTNLFLNALDVMSHGGRLDIDLQQQNGRVVIRVGDNGCGIPENILPNVFEPFFSTKANGTGTGMGLPVAQRIAHIYEGSIVVERTSPAGTVFRLEFPVYS